MASKLVRVILALGAIAGQHNVCRAASWLDEPKPASWNKPGEPIPAAPKYPDGIHPRCQIQARSPKLPEDKRLHNLGWDLIGPYQGGDRALVIGATADYDGMCRPSSYQYFVFVRGIFAGTLSPEFMESRADGALSRVVLESDTHLTAEYLRYAATDPLCCASRTTRVEFEIASDGSLVRPLSASTLPNR
jgi:hypothetical protein